MASLSDDFVLALFNAVGASLSFHELTLAVMSSNATISRQHAALLQTASEKLAITQDALLAAIDRELQP